MIIEWIDTDKHIYSSIFLEHGKQLTVFSTYTDSLGDDPRGLGHPYMITEWGFKDSELPLIKSIATKKDKDQKEWDYKYYIAKFWKGGDSK